jgi:hypothetical protein
MHVEGHTRISVSVEMIRVKTPIDELVWLSCPHCRSALALHQPSTSTAAVLTDVIDASP